MISKGQEVVILSVLKEDFELIKDKVSKIDTDLGYMFINEENLFDCLIDIRSMVYGINDIFKLITKSKID